MDIERLLTSLLHTNTQAIVVEQLEVVWVNIDVKYNDTLENRIKTLTDLINIIKDISH